MRWIPTVLTVIPALLLSVSEARAAGAPEVHNIFGRDITRTGIVLPDWDGYMANPAIEVEIVPPSGATYPVKATITAAEPRLYFNLPSTAGAQGPTKELTFTAATEKLAVSIAIFPARQKRSGDLAINVGFVDARGRRGQLTFPAHVLAFQGEQQPATFPVLVDFSQDRTGFFKDAGRRAVLQQVAADWAYYLEDLHTAALPAGAESTSIWDPTGFKTSHLVKNAVEYRGMLLYVYGIAGEELRSGGEPSQAGGFQHRGGGGGGANDGDGAELPMRRSGGVEVETRGNFNTSGWLPEFPDEQWWKATNLRENGANDLYSIIHHEMGHALFFNPNNRNFTRDGVLKDDGALRDYLGHDLLTDKTDHFQGTLDPWSLRGAFGNEYHGQVPLGRWLITRTDLLAARAVGYKLRSTAAAFVSLSIQTESLPAASTGRAYKASLKAEGGIPFYDWQVSKGTLPDGLSLNRFTGEVTGQARKVGKFEFTVLLRDYQKKGEGVSRELRIEVRREPP
jgi:hypothetical protein